MVWAPSEEGLKTLMLYYLHYHRSNKDSLFRLQNDFVLPKLRHEEDKLESLRKEFGPTPAASQRIELAGQVALVGELRDFFDEVKRVAPLWNPHFDDGVVVNFSMLWRLVPQHNTWQRELKLTWEAVCNGELEWTHLAMRFWPERVVSKCQTDRSLAIAHGLEDMFWVKGPNGKCKPTPTPSRTVAELILERSSPAVKSALKVLLESPNACFSTPRKRNGRSSDVMSISDMVIQGAVARYHREYDRYLKLCVRVAEICRLEIVEGNAIRAQVTSRAKSPKSLEGKLRRFSANGKKEILDIDSVFADSEGCRSAFRTDVDHDSEVMPISVPN